MSYFEPEHETHVGEHLVRRSWPRLRIQTRDLFGERVRIQRKTYYRSASNKIAVKRTWTVGIKLGRTTLGGKVSRDLLHL